MKLFIKLAAAVSVVPMLMACQPQPTLFAPDVWPWEEPAPRRPARVIIGELQSGPFDVSPPTRLDVKMWPGTLHGESVWTRCANMAGYYKPATQICYNVDY